MAARAGTTAAMTPDTLLSCEVSPVPGTFAHRPEIRRAQEQA
jgi:hypothetical protein